MRFPTRCLLQGVADPRSGIAVERDSSQRFLDNALQTLPNPCRRGKNSL